MAKSRRCTYTIPEPERSAFARLAAKARVSEAELIRVYIRWACRLAGVPLVEDVHTCESPVSHVSQGESPVGEVIHGDSPHIEDVTFDV